MPIRLFRQLLYLAASVMVLSSTLAADLRTLFTINSMTSKPVRNDYSSDAAFVADSLVYGLLRSCTCTQRQCSAGVSPKNSFQARLQIISSFRLNGNLMRSKNGNWYANAALPSVGRGGWSSIPSSFVDHVYVNADNGDIGCNTKHMEVKGGEWKHGGKWYNTFDLVLKTEPSGQRAQAVSSHKKPEPSRSNQSLAELMAKERIISRKLKEAQKGQGTPSTYDVTLPSSLKANLAMLEKTNACPNCYLVGAYMYEFKLRGANIANANLSKAELLYSDLLGANLRGARLRKARLTGSQLVNADLSGANLNKADLEKVNLLGANLKGANLKGALLAGAKLDSAGVALAKAKGARGIDKVVVVEATHDKITASKKIPSVSGVVQKRLEEFKKEFARLKKEKSQQKQVPQTKKEVDRKSKLKAKKVEVPAYSALDPMQGQNRKNSNAIALIIGITNYKNVPSSRYASSDAKMFAAYAQRKLGVPMSNIKLMRDKQASFHRVQEALEVWLPESIQPGRTDIYIFFAGHGLGSKDGRSLFIMPSDFIPDFPSRSSFSRGELFSILSSLKARSVSVFLDTSYSGLSRTGKALLPGVVPTRKKQSIPSGLTVFSAAGINQNAHGLDQVKQGLFSYYLMKGLEGQADKNKDRRITARELYQYVRGNVSRLKAEQTPEFKGAAGKVLVRR